MQKYTKKKFDIILFELQLYLKLLTITPKI